MPRVGQLLFTISVSLIIRDHPIIDVASSMFLNECLRPNDQYGSSVVIFRMSHPPGSLIHHIEAILSCP